MQGRLVIFILISHIGVSVNSEGTLNAKYELCAPSGLEVANFSPQEVRLGWKLERSSGCTIPRRDNVRFLGVYEAREKDPQRINVSERQISLKSLESGTKYSLVIHADDGSAISKNLVGDFRTMLEDWPSPQIEVSLVRMLDRVVCYVHWDITQHDSLSHFTAEICSPECTSRTFEATSRISNISLNYHTDYKVQIQAVFKEPLNLAFSTNSSIVAGVSPVGIPEGPVEIYSTVQDENRLHLSWESPDKPNGPIDRYDLIISDALNRSSKIQKEEMGLTITIDLPSLTGYEFIVGIRAVNVDPLTREEFASEWFEYPISRTLPDKPEGFEILNCAANSLKLWIVPSTASPSLWYHIVMGRDSGKVRKKYVTCDSEVDVHGLKAYQNVTIFASTCYSDSKRKLTCGEYVSSTMTSNVDAPSAVRDLKVTSSGEVFIVTWEEPVDRRGPIDGYKIFINVSDESGSKVFKESDVFPPYRFRFDREKLYEVSVAAFNRDLHGENVYLGKTSSVQAIKKSVVVWVSALIALAAVTAIAGTAVCIYFIAKGKEVSDASPPATVTFTREEHG